MKLFYFFLFIILLLPCCTNYLKKRIISDEIKASGFIEINFKNILRINEIVDKLTKSIQNKKIEDYEFNEVENYLRDLYKTDNTCLIFIINNAGKILIHNDITIETTNISEYIDFKKGFNRIYNGNIVQFYYSVEGKNYHVTSHYVEEVRLRIILIIPQLI